MATKKIVTTVTVHAPGASHKPFKIDGNGSRLDGHYDAAVHLPGEEVELDEKEADAILKRFGGSIVTDGVAKPVDPALVVLPKVSTDLGKPAKA